ncbi:aldehyde dehydrogenase family protein [Rhodococcus hoagii]|nr:aldehyde dehydrogenase family protein [Prescottella equi]
MATGMGKWGQACNSNKRMIVMEDLYDDFVDELVQRSSAMKPATDLARRRSLRPAVLRSRGRRAHRADRRGKEAGATVTRGRRAVSGPEGEGFYVSPA